MVRLLKKAKNRGKALLERSDEERHEFRERIDSQRVRPDAERTVRREGFLADGDGAVQRQPLGGGELAQRRGLGGLLALREMPDAVQHHTMVGAAEPGFLVGRRSDRIHIVVLAVNDQRRALPVLHKARRRIAVEGLRVGRVEVLRDHAGRLLPSVQPEELGDLVGDLVEAGARALHR